MILFMIAAFPTSPLGGEEEGEEEGEEDGFITVLGACLLICILVGSQRFRWLFASLLCHRTNTKRRRVTESNGKQRKDFVLRDNRS